MAKNIKQKSMRYDQYDYMKLMESNIPASLVETHHFDSAEDAFTAGIEEDMHMTLLEE